MNLEHIMNKNIYVANIDDSLYETAQKMKEFDIGFLPVIQKKKVVGVITDRDIVVKVLANKDSKIKDYISKDLIEVDIDESLENALKIMGEKKVKRLLVKKDNKLVGIISLSDIINYIDSNLLKTCLKNIYAINRNTDEYLTKINEFEL